MGFDPAEMVGFKAYEYFHPEDLMATSSCHTQCKLIPQYTHSDSRDTNTRQLDFPLKRSIPFDVLPSVHTHNGSLYKGALYLAIGLHVKFNNNHCNPVASLGRAILHVYIVCGCAICTCRGNDMTTSISC